MNSGIILNVTSLVRIPSASVSLQCFQLSLLLNVSFIFVLRQATFIVARWLQADQRYSPNHPIMVQSCPLKGQTKCGQVNDICGLAHSCISLLQLPIIIARMRLHSQLPLKLFLSYLFHNRVELIPQRKAGMILGRGRGLRKWEKQATSIH